MLEIRKVARRTKSCSKSEKLLKSCRATSGQPYSTTKPVGGMGLVLVLRHILLCMHVFKGLLRCKSVCDVNPGQDPCLHGFKFCFLNDLNDLDQNVSLVCDQGGIC